MAKTVLTAILVTAVVLAIFILASNVISCSWYGAKDTITRDQTKGDAAAQTTVEKKSSSVGFFKQVTAPTHAASSIGTTEIEAGATEWEEISSTAGLYLLYWFGGIAILAGVAGGIFFKRYFLGASVAAAGLTLIMVAQYIWVLLIVAALGLAAGVWFIWDSRNRNKVVTKLGLTSKTLRQTVAGVQKFREDKAPDIDTALSGAQDDDVKAAVKKIKSELAPK